MKICKAYKTSKGVYSTKEQAEKNTAMLVCNDSRFSHWREKEKVVEIWVLIPDWDFDGERDFSMPGAFILTPVDIIE